MSKTVKSKKTVKRPYRLGDRKDAYLDREINSVHLVMPIITPGRCANEAFISETLDLTNVLKYLEEKNAGLPEYKYNVFQFMVASLFKILTLRPKLNAYIASNRYIYRKKDTTVSFVVKKQFADGAAEGTAVIKADKKDNIDDVHERIYKSIYATRTSITKGAENTMDILLKIPRPIAKTALMAFSAMDKIGVLPSSLLDTDPYHASAIVTNLGSIKLHAGYHHLTEWGTTSVFLVIGEIKKRPFFKEDGTYEMRPSIDLGFTIDERLADGYYYSKTIRLAKKLAEDPYLLDRPFGEEVDYE